MIESDSVVHELVLAVAPEAVRFLARLDAVVACGQPGAYPSGDPAARQAELRQEEGAR